MAKKTITRSTGIIPKLPWAGPLPGGGYEGRTKALDLAVQKCARWLAKTFGKPIEIRFNSDQLSGGAFVNLRGDTGIKFGCRLTTPQSWRKLPAGGFLRKMSLWKPNDSTSLTFEIGIHSEVGLDLTKLKKAPLFNVVWQDVGSFRNGCATLRRHVRPVSQWPK